MKPPKDPMSLRRLPLLLTACLLLALAACGRPDEAPINVSIPAGEAAEAWTPFLADMARATGRRVERYPGASEAALIEAMRFRQTDMGWFDPAPALEVVRRGGGAVFARTVRPAAADGDRAVIIARQGSGLTLDKLLACDRTVAFGLGEGRSISGVLAPDAYLFAPRGVDPQACFKSVRVASHESNYYGVAAGVIDAAVNDAVSLARFAGRDAPAGGRALAPIEVIWSSPPIPDQTLVWRRDLDPALKARIAKFVFGYGVGEGREAERQRAVLKRLDARLFVPADDRQLLPLQEMEASQSLRRAEARRDPTAIEKARADLASLAAARAGEGS
jgi:phosphonate transport system substrate-binding protein